MKFADQISDDIPQSHKLQACYKHYIFCTSDCASAASQIFLRMLKNGRACSQYNGNRLQDLRQVAEFAVIKKI